MKKVKIINFYSLIFIFFLISPIFFTAQSFQNIKVIQQRDAVKIYYDLVSVRSDDVYKINLQVSDNNGETFNYFPKTVKGDIGYGIRPKNNLLITWYPLNDSLELIGDYFVFKITGELLGATNEVIFERIKGGSFLMGSSAKFAKTDESKVHEVFLNDFEMSIHEVTNYQYMLFLKDYGSSTIKEGQYKGEILIYPNPKGLNYYKIISSSIKKIWITTPGFEYFPVVGITWFGAYEFCKFYGYRLPSEAEWEYAARERGKDILFGNGKMIADSKEINFDGKAEEKREFSVVGNSRGSQIRVASFEPNNLNLFDMSGNVWEWCQDWYDSNYYYNSKQENPSGPWFGKYKSIRGGSWFNNAEDIRVTDRSFFIPYGYNSDIGFRPVRDISKN